MTTDLAIQIVRAAERAAEMGGETSDPPARVALFVGHLSCLTGMSLDDAHRITGLLLRGREPKGGPQ